MRKLLVVLLSTVSISSGASMARTHLPSDPLPDSTGGGRAEAIVSWRLLMADGCTGVGCRYEAAQDPLAPPEVEKRPSSLDAVQYCPAAGQGCPDLGEPHSSSDPMQDGGGSAADVSRRELVVDGGGYGGGA